MKDALKLIDKYAVQKSMYEFQLLFGIPPELRQSIIDRGRLLRVYIHYRKHWFNFSTRRLNENSKMNSDILKSLFIRR